MAVHRELNLAELAAPPAHLGDERRVVAGERVSDGVGQVDRRRAGRDRGSADACDEAGIGAGRVLARELDLVDAPGRIADGPAGELLDLARLETELELHVDRARPENDVDAGASGARESLGGRVYVLVSGSGERGDGRCVERSCDGAHALEVSRRGPCEARFDDGHPQALELLGDLSLLVRLQGDAGRLLAVSQRRIEDMDPASGHEHYLLTRCERTHLWCS